MVDARKDRVVAATVGDSARPSSAPLIATSPSRVLSTGDDAIVVRDVPLNRDPVLSSGRNGQPMGTA
jgi:hypothetical protein